MHKTLLAMLALVICAGVGASIAQASAEKISICHVTGSETNPLVQIEISQNSLSAHLGHGDVIASPTAGCDDGGGTPE